MNKVIIMGRLTKAPEVRYSNQGDRDLAIARYTLAVDRRRGRDSKDGAQNADFINCVAFDRAAEFAEKYLSKGTKLLVEGHIQTGSYTNKDGVKVYTTDVIVESQEFAGARSDSDRDGKKHTSGRPGPGEAEDFMDIPMGADDIGLPFN